jgi:SagB-type dehydrogenase family enzyme
MASHKLLLLLAPIALWLAWIALRALSGHRPTRASVTVGLSLVTLLYFTGVVGTGIFWVATQELPVFDWHYLTGYLLLALTLVHVALHWRNVAAFLRRGSPAVLVDPEKARFRAWVRAAARATALGACVTVAFMLGARHGGRELTVVTSACPADAAPLGKGALTPVQVVKAGSRTLPLAQLYHEGSSYPAHAALPGLTVKTRPDPYLGVSGPATPLPEAKPGGGVSVLQAYADWRAGRSSQPDARLTLEQLSAILYHAQGVNQTIERRNRSLDLRTAPSAGALYPVNIYVVVDDVAGLEPGVYSYHPKRGALILVKAGKNALWQLATASGSPGAYDTAPAALVLTTTFGRTAFKYEERAYRYVAMDTGHAAYNLSLTAATLGWRAPMIARFDDGAVATALGLDGTDEAPLLLIPIGKADKPSPEPLFASAPAVAGQRSFVDLIHGGTSLRMAGGGGPLPRHPATAPAPAPTDIALPAPAQGLPLLEAIRARRSGRDYTNATMTLAELSALFAASAGERADTPAQDPLLVTSAPLGLYAVVRNVAGLAPGVYRYLPLAHALAPRRAGDLSAAAEAACVQQEFCRTADVVFVKTVRWADLFLPDGDRGYRYANLRAGVVGEGLYVEAAALGLGVCGVGAFQDPDVAALVGVDPREEAPLYITTVGKKP